MEGCHLDAGLNPPVRFRDSLLGPGWRRMVEVARCQPTWVSFPLWVLPRLRTSHDSLFILEPFLLPPLLKASLASFEKSSSDLRPKITPLRGRQRVPRDQGTHRVRVSGVDMIVSPACRPSCVLVLSLVTHVFFFPAPGGCLQAVDFWGLQILYCGTSFLSVGSFSRGKGNNFLKSI